MLLVALDCPIFAIEASYRALELNAVGQLIGCQREIAKKPLETAR